MDELRKKGLGEDERGLRLGDAGHGRVIYFALTADHLFGNIWTRPGLSMRDKRIMTLTVRHRSRHHRPR